MSLESSIHIGLKMQRPEPYAALAGLYFYARDTQELSLCDGTQWSLVPLTVVFGPSGANHSLGMVPDAGDTAGSTRYLREDGTWSAPGGGGSGLYSAYLCYQDQKPSGTDGGTFTSGAWQNRDLTVEVADTGNNGTLSASQISLAAGTYRVIASCPARSVVRHQAQLYNVTDSAVLLVGQNAVADSTYGAETASVIQGSFTIGDTKTIALQHQCQATQATNGFGLSVGGTFIVTHEIYSTIELFKQMS